MASSVSAKGNGPVRQDDDDGQAAVRRIARSGSVNILGSGVSAGANFVLIVLISRLWDLETAGSLFAVTSLFLIALALCQLGVDQGLIRSIAWNNARSESRHNRRLVVEGLLAALAASLAVMVAGMLLAGPLGQLLGGTPAIQDVIVVFAAALPIGATYELLLAVSRGLAHMRPTIVVERLLRPCLQLACVLLAGVSGADAVGLALAWTAPYLLGLVLAAAGLLRILRATPGLLTGAPSGTAVVGHPLEANAARAAFWKFTIPRGLARLAQVGLQRADIALVTVLAGPSAAALYTAVTRFLVMGQMATSAMQQVSEPQLARLLARGQLDQAKMVARKMTLWAVMLTWPVYLLITAYAEWLLELLFGSSFAVAAGSLQVLACAMLIGAAMGPLDVLLLMAGRSSLSLINVALALAADVVLCLLLVPVLGIFGAAAAWASAIVLKNVLCLIQVHRTLHLVPTSREVVVMAAFLLLVFGAAPWLAAHLLVWPPAAQVAVLAAAVVLYAAAVWRRRASLLNGTRLREVPEAPAGPAGTPAGGRGGPVSPVSPAEAATHPL